MSKFNLLALGATFDLLHLGHKKFLDFAFNNSEKVLIGLTSDKYINLFKPNESVKSYSYRKENLEKYLIKKFSESRFEVKPINQNAIPEVWQGREIEALAVTPNTYKGGLEINQSLIKLGRDPLKLLEFDEVMSEDGVPISSTRIRNGTIDLGGRLYFNSSWRQKDLILTDATRRKLKDPIGSLLDLNKENLFNIDENKIISVGDITTGILIKKGIAPKISVIDLYVKRKKTFSHYKEIGFEENFEVLKIKNPAGQISWELFSTIKKIFEDRSSTKYIIEISGEDDLAVLPIMIFSPLYYHVFYGQPDVANVEIEVSLENKDKIKSFLEEFTIR